VLKVLGFVRSQVRATVAWQSSTLALMAGLIGLPLGIAAGRTAWDVFADRLGVPPQPVTPVLAVGVLVPLLLVLANVVAAVPGRVAARMRPAAALRAE
jgi:ABC-type antimicrobial peptide transport system permease subunit